VKRRTLRWAGLKSRAGGIKLCASGLCAGGGRRGGKRARWAYSKQEVAGAMQRVIRQTEVWIGRGEQEQGLRAVVQGITGLVVELATGGGRSVLCMRGCLG
jgi:hypothetical protein